MQEQIKKCHKRLEAAEGRNLELHNNFETIKKNIPATVEHLGQDLRAMNVSLQNFKHLVHQKFEEVREEFRVINSKHTIVDLERRMTERMDDIIRALTKQMADRSDTKRNFKILDKQVHNLFDLLLFYLQGGQTQFQTLFSIAQTTYDTGYLKSSPNSLMQALLKT
mmetsp:Transcript_18690/g.17801  ORF Transcript_18690/g.17801 Transcript_18690/m.17801 type:complete len:166 (-) Transcript_18690:774-1271(-)